MYMYSTIKCDEWQEMYDGSWKDLITSSAFAHPAKFSKNLIFNIVKHAIDEGFIKEQATVLDCFSGVALGALPCALQGIQWVGIELEARFHQLALANVALWTQRYGHLPQWVTPVCLQGDSRQLQRILQEVGVGAVVSSPPYAESKVRGGTEMSQVPIGKRWANGDRVRDDGTEDGYGTNPAQLGNLKEGSLDACLSSPPYAQGLGKEHTYADHAKRENDSHRGIMREKGIVDPYYGSDPAQLGNLKAGSLADALVASPPYADGCAHTGGPDPHPEHMEGPLHSVAYGQAAGQLAAMPPGPLAGVNGVMGSPPYEASLHSQQNGIDRSKMQYSFRSHGVRTGPFPAMYYGTDPAQLGTTQGTTFWEAARTILEQVYAVLKPGGAAIWVVKAYCRDGKIVDFPGDWRRLAEACGFVTLHEHHAMLVQEHGIQTDLFGGEVAQQTHKMSFFRRLHLKRRPDLAINYEVVFCMSKPLTAAPLPPDEAWEQLPLGEAVDCTIASPPFANSDTQPTALGAGRGTRSTGDGAGRNKGDYDYTRSQGNLGALPPGRVEAVLDCVVASPPYANSVDSQQHGIDWSKAGSATGNRKRGAGTKHEETLRAQLQYGHAEGQLGALPAGRVEAILDCVVSSPVYPGCVHGGNGIDHTKLTGNTPGRHTQAKAEGYSSTSGNLGSMPPGEPLPP